MNIKRYQNLLSGQKLDDFQNHQKSKKRHRFAKELWRQVILSLKKSRRRGGFSTQRCILLQYYQQSRQKVKKGGVGAKEPLPFFLFSPFCAHPVKEWEKRSANGREQWQKLRFMTLTSSFLLFCTKDLSWPSSPLYLLLLQGLEIDVNAFYH